MITSRLHTVQSYPNMISYHSIVWYTKEESHIYMSFLRPREYVSYPSLAQDMEERSRSTLPDSAFDYHWISLSQFTLQMAALKRREFNFHWKKLMSSIFETWKFFTFAFTPRSSQASATQYCGLRAIELGSAKCQPLKWDLCVNVTVVGFLNFALHINSFAIMKSCLLLPRILRILCINPIPLNKRIINIHSHLVPPRAVPLLHLNLVAYFFVGYVPRLYFLNRFSFFEVHVLVVVFVHCQRMMSFSKRNHCHFMCN